MKIFLELGAEGGSLVPILDELGDNMLTLSEAEELVGARAAGALLSLVEQRHAVKDLVDEQEDLNSVLLASARQNSTFQGQVKALRAAIDEVVISLGDWVTETNIVLELIEAISGKTTLRGFSVLTSLGLDTKDLNDLSKNLKGREKEVESFINNVVKKATEGKASFDITRPIDSLGKMGAEAIIKFFSDPKNNAEVFEFGKSLGLSADQAVRLGEIFEDDVENLGAFINLLLGNNKALEERSKIMKDAEEAEKDYLSMSEELEKFEEGSDSWRSKRDEYYKTLTDRIVDLRKEEDLLNDKSDREGLLKAEQEQLLIIEKRISLLSRERSAVRGNIIDKDEDIELDNEKLQSFEAIRKKQEALNQAIIDGDEVKRRSLAADLEKQTNLLIEADLLDDYLDYVSRIESREELLQAASGFKEAAGVLSEVLQDEIDLGKKTPEQAKEELGLLIDSYIKALDQLPAGQRDKLQKELSLLFSGTEFTPAEDGGGGGAGEKGLDLFGLGEENTDFLINKAAELANSVNGAILDATQRRLEAEQAAVDARYSFEEDRLNSLLQAGIISQEQYERQRLRLEKERVAKTNDIERKRFNAEKANSLAEIAIKTAIGIAGTADPIRIAIISAVSAAQAAIVASQKFVPTKFKKGGMIEGASHEQGGVPFTVNGRAGFEAEGGEFIVNKKATEAFLPMLERINSFGSSSIPAQRQVFANGGVVPQGGGRTDDLLEQLVSQSSQRTIAYISEEQLISRNNTRITNDIRKRL